MPDYSLTKEEVLAECVRKHGEIVRLKAAVAMSRAEADELRKARDRWIAEHDDVQADLDSMRNALRELSQKSVEERGDMEPSVWACDIDEIIQGAPK